MAKTADKGKPAQPAASDNLALWERRCTTDPAMLKLVDYGGHSYTAVRPHSQLRAATEEWGPYGWVWGLRDVRYNYIGAADDPHICEATAVFFYPSPSGDEVNFEVADELKIWWQKTHIDEKTGERWHERKEVEHWHKKLRTSLQSKALSLLGFNADVFMGEHDGPQQVGRGGGEGGRPSDPAKQGKPWSPSEKQLTRLRAIAANYGYDEAAIHELLAKGNLTSSKQLTRKQYDDLCGDKDKGIVGYFEKHPRMGAKAQAEPAPADKGAPPIADESAQPPPDYDLEPVDDENIPF